MRKRSTKGAKIKREVDDAKRKFIDITEPYCQGCGWTGLRLSVSHTISEKRCGEMGKDELRSDTDNMALMCCCDNTNCHGRWESGTREEKQALNNYDELIAFVKLHDHEGYTLMTC